ITQISQRQSDRALVAQFEPKADTLFIERARRIVIVLPQRDYSQVVERIRHPPFIIQLSMERQLLAEVPARVLIVVLTGGQNSRRVERLEARFHGSGRRL